MAPAGFGSMMMGERVRVRSDPLVSVRLKGIDRLAIPGTFRALLKADGERIAQRTFFQATEPRTCDSCRENALIDLDFMVREDAVLGKRLAVDIEVVRRDDPRAGVRVPMRVCGNPTVNVRMLLEEMA